MTQKPDTNRHREFLALLVFPLLLLAILAGAELYLRRMATADWALAPRVFYSRNTGLRPPSFSERVGSPTGLNLVFIGSSIVQTNINPRLFDQAVEDEHELEIYSYNCGLGGAGLDTTALYLKHLWLNRGRPRIVVHGVRLFEMISDDSKEANWQENNFDRRGIERMWQSRSPLEQARSKVVERLLILQYPGLFPEFLGLIRDDKPAKTMLTNARRENDGWGFNPRPETMAEKLAAGKKVAGKHQYHPRVGAKRYLRGRAKIKEIKEICDSHGALYVMVNIQEHPYKFGREKADDLYARYLSTLRDFSTEMDFRFVDPTDGDFRWIDSDQSFNDYHHYTVAGAEILTRKLAREIFAGWDDGRSSLLAE